MKIFKSKDYNFVFNSDNGFFARWGKTKDNDPVMSPYGNEILDIEITDICKGPGGIPCPFCYKSNSLTNYTNMSLDMFKSIIDKMPKTITQIAIGADAQCESNPDVWDMMKYSRSKNIIPNITVADISDDVADKLVSHCGAVAVSRYKNKNYCYDSIEKLTNRVENTKQNFAVNIHILVSEETVDQIYETMNDYINGEPRLKNLNAIVLLSLKQKGRGVGFNILKQEKFKLLVDYVMDNNIPIGFDSCSCHKFTDSIKGRDNYKQLEMLSEPCESGLFSAYINCEGKFYPCSFAEKNGDWEDGIQVDTCNDFLKDVWYNKKLIKFRNTLIENDRKCPLFDV